MRLKKHLYACICMLLIGIGSLQAKEVTLTEAGTLSGKISDSELTTLTELTVNGPINGSDIQIIRAMGGTLKTLNLKNANIVEGGNSYYLTDYFTQNDVIGDYMFYAMTALEKIVMPKDVWSIGSWNYNNPWNADKTSLSSHAKTYNTDENDSNFGCASFYQCVNLKQIEFPESLIHIGAKAFGNCVKLASITIPEGVELLGGYVFINCTDLVSASLPSTFGNPNKTTNCDVSYTGWGDISGTSSTWSNGFSNLFFKCPKLKDVTLAEGIKYLGVRMFIICYITGINFPSSLTTISNNALNYCQIDTLRLPATVTEIGNSAFRYAKFDCVEIPSTVTKINSNAFYDAEIRGSLNITPNAALAWADGTPFRCYGSEYITNEDGTSYNRYWHLPDVYWNSAAEFPRDKFGQIDNLYLPANGSVSNNNDIGYIFYNGLTKRIDIAYTNENRKYSFSVNKEMKTQMINYRKYFSTTSGYGEAAGWKTIVLPFDVKEISYERDGYNEKDTVALAPFGSKALETAGTLPFWLYELGTDGNYKAATEIKAHKAYLICMPNNDKYPSENNISGYVNFTTSDATNGVTLKPTAGALKRSKGTKFDFVPTYEGVMQHDTVYVLNENNSYYADDKTYQRGSVFIKNYSERYSSDPAVYPFEAYLVTNEGKTSVASAPMLYSIGGGDGTITGIEDIPFATPEKATKAYSRDGVLYINTNADRTINIYDVTGRTVRIIEAREGMNEVHGLDSGIYLLEGQKVVIGR